MRSVEGEDEGEGGKVKGRKWGVRRRRKKERVEPTDLEKAPAGTPTPRRKNARQREDTSVKTL